MIRDEISTAVEATTAIIKNAIEQFEDMTGLEVTDIRYDFSVSYADMEETVKCKNRFVKLEIKL